MTNLNRQQKAEIVAFDAAHRVGMRNLNRFYAYLTVEEGGDVGVRSVAVKAHTTTGKVWVKEVVRASVDSERMRIRDLGFKMLAGYYVDWSNEGLGRKHSFDYKGHWGIEPYSAKHSNWKLWCPVVNTELLKNTERFKYCAWTHACGNILDYLKHYAERPRIECLAKSGIGWLATRRSFCAKLETDPALMSWVAKNREEIEAKGGNVAEIMYACKHRGTILEARAAMHTAKEFNGLNLPKSVDRLALSAWVHSQNIGMSRYLPYLGLCTHYKLDMRDTKNLKPRDFESRMCELQDRRDAEYRAEQIEREKANRKAARGAYRAEEKRIDAAVAEAIPAVRVKFAKVEEITAPFNVYLPTTEADLQREADGMGCSCVWSYGNRISRGTNVVVFVRMPDAPDKPYVTVDFTTSNREINQCYATDNTKPDKPVLDFVYGTLRAQLRRLCKRQKSS